MATKTRPDTNGHTPTDTAAPPSASKSSARATTSLHVYTDVKERFLEALARAGGGENLVQASSTALELMTDTLAQVEPVLSLADRVREARDRG